MTSDEKVAEIEKIFSEFTRALGGVLGLHNCGQLDSAGKYIAQRQLAMEAMTEIGRTLMCK